MTTSEPTTAQAILDAAEARLCMVGYHGFSFRDLAGDVGIRSASVHYHFPTKEALVTRLTKRYRERFFAAMADAPPGTDRIIAYREAFRDLLARKCAMCLCGLLGAESYGLPRTVRQEVRRFFEDATIHLAEGLQGEAEERRRHAAAILARLQGAVLLARAYEDVAVYDRATAGLEAALTRGPGT